MHRAWLGGDTCCHCHDTLPCCLGLRSGQNTERGRWEKMSAIEEEMSLLSPPPHPRCSKKGKLVVWSHAKAQAVLPPFHPLDTSGGLQPLVGVTVPVIFHCLRPRVLKRCLGIGVAKVKYRLVQWGSLLDGTQCFRADEPERLVCTSLLCQLAYRNLL